jgi:hypothetical protein
MTELERIENAHREAAELRGFYSHFTLYAGVILLLGLVDAATGGFWWVQWPALGWGIGLVAHAAALFGRNAWGTEWEERKVASILAHQRPPAGPRPHA